MSTGNDNTGCLFQIMTIILSLWFGYGLFTGASVSIKPLPVLEVIVTSANEDLPFALQNNTLIYSHKDTLDRPCNRIIEGYIYSIDGKPNTELVVNSELLPLEDSVEPDWGYQFPYAASTVDEGPSTWNWLLPTWIGTYKVWLSQTVGGEPISPQIFIQHQGCDYNKATINFVQIKPLPQDNN